MLLDWRIQFNILNLTINVRSSIDGKSLFTSNATSLINSSWVASLFPIYYILLDQNWCFAIPFCSSKSIEVLHYVIWDFSTFIHIVVFQKAVLFFVLLDLIPSETPFWFPDSQNIITPELDITTCVIKQRIPICLQKGVLLRVNYHRPYGLL